ncbi:hypothetical protein HXX76_000447 [Chlamydomonas incerta]|uniref:Uncharacterized protein n=1 Tax=Chlamydomonas incerta TaxID=51695 RepID=A0A835WEC5_CHLIN|nr:hypothetical protein HXX76_000447 [Chlamydomonas incerta]|eukprot:KAG2445843.1 hypothetical protein HXX76_000447 [Chlamydomonas incerta]
MEGAPALAPESAQGPAPHPDGLLGVLRTLPPDTLATSFWCPLDGASRRAFRASCCEADAWARTSLMTCHATVQLNAHYLEALGCVGRPLLEHLPALRSLVLRQATAGRKPLPAEVVAACLDLLAPQQRPQPQPQQRQQQQQLPAGAAAAQSGLGAEEPQAGGCGAVAGSGAAARIGPGVRRLALVGWPSLEVAQLGLLAGAMPGVEELELVCRTRAFPHNFVAPGDLLPALPALLPRLRQLRLAGLGLQHHHTATDTAAGASSSGAAAAAAATGERHSEAGASRGGGAGGGHGGGAAAVAGGFIALAQLRWLTRLQLSTVDLPRPLAAQLGELTQLRELELELWLVMTPADELRGWARAVGRGVGALAAAAAAGAPAKGDGGTGEGPGRLRSLRLQLRNCVEEVAGDEEQAVEEEGEDPVQVQVPGGHAAQHAGRVPCDGGSLMVTLLAAIAAAVGRARHQQPPAHRHQQRPGALPGGGVAGSSGAPGHCGPRGGDASAGGLQLLQLPGHHLSAGDWLQLLRLPGLRRVEASGLEQAFEPWGAAAASIDAAAHWRDCWTPGLGGSVGAAAGAAYGSAEGPRGPPGVVHGHWSPFELVFVEEAEEEED